IPYLALSAKLTSNYHERGVLAALRIMFAGLGALLVAFAMPALVQRPGADPHVAWSLAALVFACGATVVFAVSFLATREPVAVEAPVRRTERAIKALASDVGYFWNILRRNGPLARLFIAVTVGYVASQMFGKCLLYWFKYSLHDEAFAKYAL